MIVEGEIRTGDVKGRGKKGSRGRCNRLFAALALVAATLGSVTVSTPAEAAGGPVSGEIFVDYDRDGRSDVGEDADPVLAGITVTAYDAAGGSTSVTTGSDGAYSIDTSALAGTNFRIEFDVPKAATGAPVDYRPSFSNAFGNSVPDSGTTVQFVDTSAGPATDVVLGIVPDSECPVTGTGGPSTDDPAGNPSSALGKVWTTCYVNGVHTDATGPQDVLVGANSYDTSNIAGRPSMATTSEHLGTKDEMGSIWGLAYDEWDGVLYSSAVVKRHTDLGPEGIDGLYWIDYAASAAPSLAVNQLSLDGLSPSGAPSFGVDPAVCPTDGAGNFDYSGWTVAATAPGGAFDCRDLGGAGAPSHDWWAFDRTGRSGIGDIDVTPDGHTLLVMNATAETLFVYDITSGTPVYSNNVTITDPGCVGGSYEAWATTAIDAESAYVGVTCTGDASQDRADLDGNVVEVNFLSGAQTTITTIDMDYEHGCSGTANCGPNNGNYQPWLAGQALPAIDEMYSISQVSSGEWAYRGGVSYNQPLIADLSIDSYDGSIAVSVVDRWAMMMGAANCDLDPTTGCGYDAPAPPVADYDGDGVDDPVTDVQFNMTAQTSGDLLRVCNTSSNPDSPTFALEGQPGCDPTAFAPPGTSPEQGYGPNGTHEYYWNDAAFGRHEGAHPEAAQGGSYIGPRNNDIAYVAMNPEASFGAGFTWDSNRDGSGQHEYQLYRTQGLGTFAKGVGLGDVEGCAIPIEIGNFVWLDLDGDGVQDPGETPLEGVTVTLLDSVGNVVAITTTGPNGDYYFDTAAGVLPNTDYTISFDPATNVTPLPGGFTNADLSETIADSTASTGSDNSDSDIVGGELDVTTGGNGHNDHSLDAGYTLPFDQALEKTVDTTTIDPATRTATFLIEVTNQGQTIENFEVIDYLDYPTAGMWEDIDIALNPAGTTDPVDVDYDGTPDAGTELAYSWDDTNPQQPVVSFVGVLPLGQSVEIPVVLMWADPLPSGTTTLQNWAEISNFDDGDPATGDATSGDLVDVDSTPGADASDDIQPAGPGAPTDGEIDDDGTLDEDDHDVAGFALFDLALRKQLADGTNLGAALPGDTVTFTITVFNQGLVDASGVTVTDYLPTAGLTLADAAWTDNGDGTADIAIAGPLSPGSSTTVDISFTVDDDASGLINNWAEISAADPTDTDGNTVIDPVTGVAIVDIDSTPDADPADDNQPTGPNDPTDDTVDEDGLNGGDEDDHDVAGVMIGGAEYSVGNQVWFDTNNNGVIDPGETPIQGVWMELFTDVDGDGLPDDQNGDGVIDVDDAIATTGTDADGNYLFDELSPGAYIVGIPPMEWDAGGPLYGYLSSDPTSTNPNDDVDDDDNGFAGPGGYVWSGPVTIGDGEPTGEVNDNDPNTLDGNENLTVDFGFYQPVFDMALFKQLADGSNLASVAPGDEVTFTLTVINQGTVDASNLTIVDYVPAGLTLADSDWTAQSNGTATTTIAGTISAGTTITIDITFTVNADATGRIENWAEIASATPVDPLGNTITMPNGDPLPDIDSVADASNSDVFGTNDSIDGSGVNGGDEDDHDVAQLVITPATLAFTGASSTNLASFAMASLLAGAMAVVLSNRYRRRREDPSLG